MNLRERYESLDEELKSKLLACRSRDELLQTLADAGMELSTEELSLVTGGKPDATGKILSPGFFKTRTVKKNGPLISTEMAINPEEEPDGNPLKYWIVDGCTSHKSTGCNCD